MKILAIDTSSDACSAALQMGDDSISRFVVEPRAHTRLILPMIEEVLQEAGITLQHLDALAFGCGPGAFTGVRIATGVIQGLALATDKPVIPVSTLAAVAQQAAEQYQADRVLVTMDARMDEVYSGCFVRGDGLMQLQGEERVCKPIELPKLSGNNWLAAGSGWRVYHDELKSVFIENITDYQTEILPDARFMLLQAKVALSLGQTVSAEQAQPVYLRNKVAKTLKERSLNK